MSTAEVTLRRYRLHSTGHEGWAIIVIGSDGYFSAVSDWGNYAYIWGSMGSAVREFLVDLEPHYFWTKITHGREAQVWDEDQVEKNIRERLDEMVTQELLSKDDADYAFDEAQGSVGNCESVLLWIENHSSLRDFDPYEGITATRPEAQSWGFATKVLPRFQAMLREELAAEALPTGGEARNGATIHAPGETVSRIETVMHKCDWCSRTEPADTAGYGPVPPKGWEVLDGAGVCDELCAECVAGISKLVAIAKGARAAGLPFQAMVATGTGDHP